MARRGYTLEQMREWPAYSGRPEGSEACIKPNFVLTSTFERAIYNSEGVRTAVMQETREQKYICTVFRQDDPVIVMLKQSLPGPSSAPLEIEDRGRGPERWHSWKVITKIGRMCADHAGHADPVEWGRSMANGCCRLSHAVRTDLYWGTRSYSPENAKRRRKHAAEKRELNEKWKVWKTVSAPLPDDRGEMGVRIWRMGEDGLLRSITRQYFVWTSSRVRAESFTVSDVVHGDTGIHAYRMPGDVDGWLRGAPTFLYFTRENLQDVYGIVERFGLYVLGTEGWRAEEAVIRKLWANSPEQAALLRAAYPDVEVESLPSC